MLAVPTAHDHAVESLVRSMLRTASQAAAFQQALAAQLGISPTDLECLTLLQELGPASAGQLADVLGLTTGAITGVVDRLAAAGFVVRESDPSDRRRVIVRLVSEHVARVDAAYAPLLAAAGADLEVLPPSDVESVRRFLRSADGWLQHETARIKAELAGPSMASELRAPLGDVARAYLEFSTGAYELRLFASQRPNDLYKASFEGPQPSVRVNGGSVVIRYRRMTPFDFSRHSGTVALNATVPWSIVVRGGASNVSLDMRGLQLVELSLGGGASKSEILLPQPVGTVPLCIDGGVNRLNVRRPYGVPAQLRIQGGANRLEFDDQRFGAVGGAVRLASPGWESVPDRYDIEIRGGASRFGLHQHEEVLNGAHAE